jgi:acyl-CoA hydrolase
MDGKTISETRVEISELMMPPDANIYGNVHGGSIMKLIDNAATIAAFRHARTNVVTASLDRLDFWNPVFIGNVLTLKASINYAGRTSMEVGVRVDAEDLLTGTRSHCVSAFLTFVALGEDGKPTEIPPLILETEKDQRRWNDAEERREARLQHLRERQEMGKGSS